MEHKRKIYLKDMGTLEIECDEKLFEAVRKHFNTAVHDVTDEMLQQFFTDMCSNAIDKAENSLL
jgi:hypothetical protein